MDVFRTYDVGSKYIHTGDCGFIFHFDKLKFSIPFDIKRATSKT